MHTTNTAKSGHRLPRNNTFGNRLFPHWQQLIILCLSIGILAGCFQETDLDKAKNDILKSQAYYEQAAAIYKQLIQKGKDLDRLHFELGRLYYAHGEYIAGIEEFKESKQALAKKYLAISYYRIGNFRDALEIFNKQEIPDDEYLYYYGLDCEKLNLYDQALKIYKKIQDDKFISKARERMDIIEKQANLISIKDMDASVYNILANAPASELYPDAGALVLLSDENVEITLENTEVSSLHYLIKILNERGKEDFSEAHIEYDSTFEKVELVYARTIKPDGTVVDVGSRHIRDVSKYLNFPLYSNARVYIISFPEITEGAVIEYKLKIYNNELINKKDFVLAYTTQSHEPIMAANFSVALPKDKPLHIKIINDKYNDFGAKLNADIQEKDGRLIYSWQFKDIPQIIPEPNMPPDVQINPTLLISTFNNWQDIYNWWWLLAKDKVKADEAIKSKVRELIKSKSSEEDKIRAIYNFCAQKIRYVAVEYGKAGYEPHSACDVFKNKYGDCKDKAILLVTMFKEAGITGWPVLIATKDYYNLNEDFPSVAFNHCIVAIGLQDKIIFLDPTAETCAFMDLPADDQARRVLVFKEEGFAIEETPLLPADHNLIKQSLSIRINNDETIAAQKSIFSFGFYDQAQRYRLLYMQPELIKEMLNEKIQDISIGAKLNNYEIKNLEDLNKEVVLSYDFVGPEYFTTAGNLRIMPQLASVDTSLVAKDKRKYALDFNILDTRDTELEVTIPKGFLIKYIPDSITEDSPWFRFVAEYNHKNDKIYFKQIVQVHKNMVSEGEYADFKKFLESLAKKTKQRIVLETKK